MVRSRLSKKIEQKTKKNFALSILGIVIIALLALKFGIPLLVNFSLFLSGSGDNDVAINRNLSFISPPVLDSLPDATSSAKIVISGLASKDQTISLYVNDNPVDTVQTQDDGKFTFEAIIKPGENTIKTKAIVNDNESDFSNTLVTIFKSAPPFLSVSSPANGNSFSKEQNVVEVRGTTDANVRVTVNGFWAITEGSGNFSYSLPLQNGENKIMVLAIDQAGNQTEKEINVTYSP